MKTIVFLLGLMILVGGCTTTQPTDEDNFSAMDETDNDTDNSMMENNDTMEGDDVMKVENGDTIKVEYRGTFPDTGVGAMGSDKKRRPGLSIGDTFSCLCPGS